MAEVRISKQRTKQSSLKNIERVQKQLDSAIAEKNYYEALQFARTIYWRLSEQEHYQPAFDLMVKFAGFLSENSQESSLYDVCILIVEVMAKTHTKVDIGILQLVLPLMDSLTTALLKKRFINALLKWSQKEGENKRGDENIHSYAAKSFHSLAVKTGTADASTRMAHEESAIKHYLHGRIEDYPEFANMLIEMSLNASLDLKSEDHLICQTTMQLLCLFDLRKANTLFDYYTTKHPNITKAPYKNNSLIQLTYFMLEMCQRDCPALYEKLKKDSIGILIKFPELVMYMDKIGEIVFKIQRQQSSNMLSNLFSSLMSGGTDDE